MIHAAADEEDDEEEEMQLPPLPLPPDPRPRGSRATRGRWRAPRRGKSKLLTLRASVADDEDDDEEYDTNQEEGNDTANAEEENQAFVPMGLRSVTAVHSEVEETMEEVCVCALSVNSYYFLTYHSMHIHNSYSQFY